MKLWSEGTSIRSTPSKRRREALVTVAKKQPVVVFGPHVDVNGRRLRARIRNSLHGARRPSWRSAFGVADGESASPPHAVATAESPPRRRMWKRMAAARQCPRQRPAVPMRMQAHAH